jgi:hypothetical protein
MVINNEEPDKGGQAIVSQYNVTIILFQPRGLILIL